jgi:fumarate reductase subunit C
MEWMAEGITHIWIALLVILATAVEGGGDPTTQLVYIVSAGILVVLAVLTAATGAQTPVIWFRVCPVVLTSSAALLVLASVV